ncbi:MAG: hypothetical protein DCC65_02765 [Planctomycetota bacterium]|nr:MAG: hypothetical protein DCC65_02765 [Planctomycetota bacterium]
MRRAAEGPPRGYDSAFPMGQVPSVAQAGPGDGPEADMIDTSKVTDRRRLHFDNPRQLHSDVDRIVASERTGTLRRTGNWTTGQILGHLAAWIDYAYDGYPVKPPWFIKFILRFAKKRFLRGPLKVGVKIPKVPDGTYATEPLSVDEGLARFNRAWARLQDRPPTAPNILFGPLTHEEWIQLNLRHAELHLGFLHPR